MGATAPRATGKIVVKEVVGVGERLLLKKVKTGIAVRKNIKQTETGSARLIGVYYQCPG